MALSEQTGTKKSVKKQKSTKDKGQVAEGWELFDAGDLYETKELETFNYFLNSKGTSDIEISSVRTKSFAIIIRGEVEDGQASVIFEDDITNIKHSDRVDMVTAIYFLPGVGNIVKNRMGATLAAYFNVEPKE